MRINLEKYDITLTIYNHIIEASKSKTIQMQIFANLYKNHKYRCKIIFT